MKARPFGSGRERVVDQTRTSRGTSDWACLIALVIIWGTAFAAISVAVETIDPIWVVTGRLVIAAVGLGSWMILRAIMQGKSWREPFFGVNSRSLVVLSFVGVVCTAAPFLLYAIAAETTPSAVLAICNGGTPMFTALLAHGLIPGDRLTVRRAIGVGLGFLGLAVLVGPEAFNGTGAGVTGLAAAILGAALYAGGNVGTRLAPRLSPLTSSVIITGSGSILALPAALLLVPVPMGASTASLAAVAFLGLLPTALAMILYVWLIQRAGPMFVSFTTYLSPLWAAGIGLAFMNETISASAIAALVLILAGVAVASRSPGMRS